MKLILTVLTALLLAPLADLPAAETQKPNIIVILSDDLGWTDLSCYGSVMGNASSHDNRNLPFLLAGGGFKHGQHLAFPAEKNHPIGTVFVSMLQRLGIEAERFGSATTTMKGVEMV